jgi:Ca-activated chloride channel family protein
VLGGVAILTLVAALGRVAARGSDDSAQVGIPALPKRPAALKPRAALRLDVNLVLIPVLVTDPYQRPVRGLQKESFRLFEGESQQQITQFFSDETPVSVGIIFDASNSMRNKIERTRQAVSEFLRMSTPGDEFFLIRFSDRPEQVSGFTNDIETIDKGVHSIEPGGWTALYDAIYFGINRMKHAKHERRVLLILSDGGDNNSRYSERETRRMLREADLRVFTIAIQTSAASLDHISEETGGRAIRVKKIDELPDMAANLSREIHSEYVLGYSPSDAQKDGKYRKVRVELAEPAGISHLRTSWKRGYYGPAE